MSKRQILITTALPYANGELHLGYILEAIQADIWARFQRLCGNECLFLSGNDAHGTGVMLLAQKKGITPEALVDQIHAEHMRDLQQFFISFDNFYSTHSPENKELLKLIYHRIQENDDITSREITQAYDPVENIFLADRFIRGTCPRCKAEDQYGDSCEVCGATYNPMDLINPVSAISGAKPIAKASLHYFFKLEKYANFLKNWSQNQKHLQPQVANKLKEWFEQGLKQWDISRDAPYFGFEIPDAPGKYFYVWLDAPIGYMAALKNLSASNPQIKFDRYWSQDSAAEVYHFIGKDIIYFHALFWPAMLASAQFRLPTSIFVHGFLTINGNKMSKSRGTFITAKRYLENLPAEYLRYYFAAKLNDQVEDIDINLEDFVFRVNSDLVGKFVNLASRSAGFINKKFNNQLATTLHDAELFQEFVTRGKLITDHYENLNYHRALREIMALADRANQYIDANKPWTLAKDEQQNDLVQAICTQGLNLFYLLSIYLKPVLPITAMEIEKFLNIPPMTWDNTKPLLAHAINTFKPLLQRITLEQAEQLFECKTIKN